MKQTALVLKYAMTAAITSYTTMLWQHDAYMDPDSATLYLVF